VIKATCLAGVDVCARQAYAAILHLRSGELAVSRLRVAPEGVVSFLARLWGARAAGIDVRVLAPGSVPKGSGDRVETDRRDAIRELRFALVPSEEEEALRDLIRCIEDLRGDLMRVAPTVEDQDGAAWTPKHSRRLRSLSFEGCAQATFADYCSSSSCSPDAARHG